MGEVTPFETGLCRFTVKYVVSKSTSGNEIPGPWVTTSVHGSELDAEIEIANGPGNFTKRKGEWVGNGGYTRAIIKRVVEYGPPLACAKTHDHTREQGKRTPGSGQHPPQG